MTMIFGGPPKGQLMCRWCGEQADEAAASWCLLDVETPTGVCHRCAAQLHYDVVALGETGRGSIDLEDNAA